MARQVIVRDDPNGRKADPKTLYKAPNNKYYSSKAAYDAIVEKQTYWMQCINAMCELFEYKEGTPPNTYIMRSLKELEPYGYDVVLDTINAQADTIRKILSQKEFDKEIFKIKYTFAIINNNVADVYNHKRKVEQEDKIVEFKNYSHGLEEIDSGYDIGGVSGKGRDVSKLLGDNIWT